MKKYFKMWKMWKMATLSIWAAYLAIWLSTCFVNFELYNPIQPFLDIPNETEQYRASLLVIFIIVVYVKWMVIVQYSKK